MKKVIVTGAAGFIGSHLSERLISKGFFVVGIDRLSDYYSKEIKLRNIKNVISDKNFLFIEKNILEIKELDKDIEFIFHVAAQPGVRKSWGKEFEMYVKDNVIATQYLLELSKELRNLNKFIYSSSSSVYGDTEEFPTSERVLPNPKSPYGVTKLAGEHLCNLYCSNYKIPIICLRYFTVFGPRQRPDMAFHKFITAMLKGEKIVIFGDGQQTRDFTYVDDIVNANLIASESDFHGEVFNVGGGNHTSVINVVNMIKRILKKEVWIEHSDAACGDVRNTEADVGKMRRMLGFTPEIELEKGLLNEITWIREFYDI